MNELKMSHRYLLKIAYDGTRFSGWQVQPKKQTIQGELEQLITKMMSEDSIRIEASGRTDTGVHARIQVAHVDLPRKIDPVYFLNGLNAQLPGDIRVKFIKKVSNRFHARFDAKGKEYRYLIDNSKILSPSLRKYRFHEHRKLNVLQMQNAANFLVGHHDFASFSSMRCFANEDTVRDLTDLVVIRRGSQIVIQAKANGFLYKMVRSIAGYLIEVGLGRFDPNGTKEILDRKKRKADVKTAQPQGLFLWNVFY